MFDVASQIIPQPLDALNDALRVFWLKRIKFLDALGLNSTWYSMPMYLLRVQ